MKQIAIFLLLLFVVACGSAPLPDAPTATIEPQGEQLPEENAAPQLSPRDLLGKLEAVAEACGFTVEELQGAMSFPPNMERMAEELGISAEALQTCFEAVQR